MLLVLCHTNPGIRKRNNDTVYGSIEPDVYRAGIRGELDRVGQKIRPYLRQHAFIFLILDFLQFNIQKQGTANNKRGGKWEVFVDNNQLVLYERFLTIIRELTEVAQSIAKAEEEKAVALSLKRHNLLDGFMKKEQAYILKLRGWISTRFGWQSLWDGIP